MTLSQPDSGRRLKIRSPARAGVIDQNVEPPLAPFDFGAETIDFVHAGNIGCD
jgi:hypothetical protein